MVQIVKIAYLAKNTDHGSGGGRYAQNVIKNTRSLGYEVVVFKEEDDGQEGESILRRGLRMFTSAWKLRRATRDCDVVHALDVWPYGVHGYLAVVGTNKQLFLSGVGTYSVVPLEPGLKRLLLKPALKRAKSIFCISRYVKDEMEKRMPIDNTQVVHMGFSPLPTLSEEAMSSFRKKYGLVGAKGPILLTVGGVKHRKGQLDTLKSVARLKDKYPNVLYIMLGTMYETAYIAEIRKFARENGLEKNIMLVGDAKSDEDLAFFYGQCDLFVMNSNNSHGHFEGFGLVFLEAASFGKPVVGSTGCGIEDAIENGFNGYLANQGDRDDIAGKIDLAIANKVNMGKNSLEFVKRFSWEKTAEKYLESYK